MLKEYIAHQLIGTPFESPVRRLRELTALSKQLKHPELKEIYAESSRIDLLMERIINDSMNCIDIGCHLGSVVQQMKRLSPRGRHIAIEPVPYKANWLKRKFPDVEVMQLALSDKEGEAEFFVQPERSGFSGLRLHGEGTENVERIVVRCERLDDIVPLDRPIGFIKVDVEGGELAVLRGGEELLKRSRPAILFECTKTGLQAFQIDPKDIYDFLVDRHGYAVFLLKDWLLDGERLIYEKFVQAMQYPFQAFNFLAMPKT